MLLFIKTYQLPIFFLFTVVDCDTQALFGTNTNGGGFSLAIPKADTARRTDEVRLLVFSD